MIGLLLVLALLGLITWLVVTYIPMPAPMPTIIIAIMVILMILYVLSVVGFDLPLPRVR